MNLLPRKPDDPDKMIGTLYDPASNPLWVVEESARYADVIKENHCEELQELASKLSKIANEIGLAMRSIEWNREKMKLAASSQWIDQSKCKPNVGEFVVGFGPSNHTNGQHDICIWDGNNWLSECGTEFTELVTHWMALPPPPTTTTSQGE